jgi:hypothetical protein
MPSSNRGISIDDAGKTKHSITYNVFCFFKMKHTTTNLNVRLFIMLLHGTEGVIWNNKVYSNVLK